MIKGFVFDLDGVLTDTAEYHYQAWKNLAKKLTIEIDREFNEQLKGVSRMDSLNRILAYGNKENDYSEEEKERFAHGKNEEYKKLIEQITEEDLLPGVTEFLDDLKKRGYKSALASASKNAPTILNRLKIADRFEGIVDPAELKNGKPDPEIFIKGAEILGLDTTECVGVEDAEAGILGINSANMFSVGIGDPMVLTAADLNFETTSELSLDKIIEAAEK
ncbi:beta-phosphoglucomutase [Lacticigenium naphthae]|uniref:beta-phosphoglucomutase n=1 Tax=Lacticigenium naphthae TaxID=515351 RepID=UPI0003FD8427|nr:beta-phosphoglucomutase [Lacticigenium naphthae]